MIATVAIAGSEDVLGRIGPSEPGAAQLALTQGFQQGMLVAAGISLAAALGAGLLLRRAERRTPTALPIDGDAVAPTATPEPVPA